MDSLMVMNYSREALCPQGTQRVGAEALEALMTRIRRAGGVVVWITAPDTVADEPGSEKDEKDYGNDDVLFLQCPEPNAFIGVEDLAPGLHDLSVDRVIIAGIDTENSIWETAMAALVHRFEVTLVSDALFTSAQEDASRPEWLAEAETYGATIRDAQDIWIRM